MKKEEYDVSDPGHYDPLIADQKKRVRQYPDNSKEWLELGRLYQAKKDLTNSVAKRNLGIRYTFTLYVSLAGLAIFLSIHKISSPLLPVWHYIVLISWQQIVLISILIIFILFLSYWLWSLRYPPSGGKYFKKAIALDPDCGEAYEFLGLIALRRFQKRKACRFLEQAIRLNFNKSRIERELKSIYEREFLTFFNRKTDEEIRQRQIIDSQLEQIQKLRSRISSLERLNKGLSGRVEQAKWEANHKGKSLNKEMADRITTIRKDYEKRFAAIKQDKESQEEAKELVARDFVRLTTEIMEAKAQHEKRSFEEAARTVEDIMGSRLWQALSEQARSYLATAEHIFFLLTEEENPDYSMVGIEMCKALETEINRTLVEPFLKYLNGNRDDFLKINQTGENKGKPFYFTYLAKVVDQGNFPEVTALTLGQYHFILERTLEGEYALKEYGNFMDEFYSTSALIIGRPFLRKLETLTKRYRNTIVHQSPMNRKECEHLRELIFAKEDALLKTCCKIVTR